MDLQLQKRKYLVTGASAGLGKAVAQTLLENGAQVQLVARNESNLRELADQWANQASIIPGDITNPDFLEELKQNIPKDIYGAFFNTGGPPAATIEETTMKDWDEAYHLVLRWKIDLSKILLKQFKNNNTGRLLFSESASVNYPIPNLVLSNSFRMAVVGYMKTLTKEIHAQDITANVIAPGYHDTGALDRLINKTATTKGISNEEAREFLKSKVPVGHLGQPREFASLAAWLLSPLAGFASGQVFALDGGVG
ncbi:MAG: SDR family oxidoreductase [Marinilabilia sp.]